MEYQIINNLQNAYDASTMACNRFAEAIAKIAWDEKFQADGETYFIKGRLTVTVQSLDPFKQLWKPSYMFGNLFGEF